MRFEFDGLLRSLSAGVLIAAGLGLAGCTQVYDVKVDAMQNKEVQSGYSYRIVPKKESLATQDANYHRAEKMVSKALAGHGMYPAPDPEKAEVVVEIDYDVGVPRVEVQSTPTLPGDDVIVPLRRGRVMRDPMGYPLGIGGGPDIIQRTVSEKKLTIVAREGPGAAKDGTERPPRELWRVEVRTDDEAASVDEALPVLVGAAVDHIGTDSSSQQVKRMTDDAEPVNFVKGGS